MQNGHRSEVVVVTGASAGIGRATVRAFAERGARIGLVARGRDGLEGARRDVEERGGEALVVAADVADPEQVEEAAAAVEDAFGSIDVWVNAAMSSIFSPVMDVRPEEFKRVTEVTYLGYVYGTLAALKRMVPRNRGTIVQVGSALAYRSIPLQAAYCGAKSAIRGFTDSLRSELLHDRSRVWVTMVQLPAHNTPQFEWVKVRLRRKPQPVPPVFQPEVAAEAIYWAAHHRRRELYVSFSSANAILANMVAPGLLDRYLARKGYSAQQYDGPPGPNRRDNLWEPVPGDHGAHGTFGNIARQSSLQLWLSTHREWLMLAAGIGLAGVALGRIGSNSAVRKAISPDRMRKSLRYRQQPERVLPQEEIVS